MDVNAIIQLVGSLGFPIAASIGLFWYVKYQDDKHTKEIESLRQTVENNTIILTKLYERMCDDDGR